MQVLHETNENLIKIEPVKEEIVSTEPVSAPAVVKKKTLKKKKPRIELFEEIDVSTFINYSYTW